jgi:preprotein translocase subunit SecD
MTPRKKVFIIFLIFIVCVYISLPSSFKLNFGIFGRKIDTVINRPNLNIKIAGTQVAKNFDLVMGLDLAGGSHLVFEADTKGLDSVRKASALESLRNTIEKRVNLFGVSEPNVQLSSFEGKDRVVIELPGVKDTEQAIELIGKTAQLVFAEIGTEEEPGLIPTDLTGADLTRASVTFDTTTGEPGVGLEFTDEGERKFSEITGRNIGKVLPIILDNQLVSQPVVSEQIFGGNAQISGKFTTEEAKELAIQLNAGALPLSIQLVEQRTVGATLGGESIRQSVIAGLVGLSMVLLFMILAYGKLGLIADIALIFFGVITLAIYKLIPVVLTLPGIAGFLLSVGMAVDSNILIFERFKEEIKKRDYRNALEVSFGRAWDSIRDANIATLVAAFVLANPLDFSFLNTSGPVRGFAITLTLGIIVSLFTGVVVSRNLLRVFVKENKKN